jgi:amidase
VIVTLVEASGLLRAGKLSPVELIQHALAQHEQHNPTLNAFILTYFDQALAAARESERRLREGCARPLEGIPLTIKDSFDIAGSPTACGSLLYAGSKAAQDATSVRRLREAGAIILGKTSCPEFLMNYETDNHLIGPTSNPWNRERTAGGSSGGESAAIAAGISMGGMGSDAGGSIRWPAHACGIAGLKPTPGRVSAAGHVPQIAHPGGLLGVAGPMARTAADVKMLFEVLAHYDPADPFSTPVPQCWLDPGPDVAAFRNSGSRIGLLEGWYGTPVQRSIAAAVENAARTLSDLGFVVEPFQPQGLERAEGLWWFFFTQLWARVFLKSVEDKRGELHWTGIELFEQALNEPEPSIPQLLENFAVRDKMRTSLLEQMETHRVLLMPAAGVTAFPHRSRQWPAGVRNISLREAMSPLTPFNLFGMPGLVIPFGMDEEGMPCGIQLVGRPYDEELLLEIGIALESARGPFPTPPGYNAII